MSLNHPHAVLPLKPRPEEGGGFCPTCSGRLDKSRLIVDLDSNTVSYAGNRWSVTPKIAELLHTLAKSWPRPVKDWALRVSMWGSDDDQAGSILSVYAHKARVVMEPMGFKIVRANQDSYRLVFPHEAK